MTKHEQLLDFYTKLLVMIGLTVEEDGGIYVVAGGKKLPAQVPVLYKESSDNPEYIRKDLVLPTRDRLRSPTEGVVFFHPLSEQMTRGESEVFRYFKRGALVRLNTYFTQVGSALIQLQRNPLLQQKMSIDQITLIKGISDVSKTASESWSKCMISPIISSPLIPSQWPLNIHVRRNGVYGAKSYRRVAIADFPLFNQIFRNELLKSDDGKNLYSLKDYETIKQVGKAIFSEIDRVDRETLGAGYDGVLAPYFISFLMSYAKIAERLTHFSETLMDPFLEVGATKENLIVPCFDARWVSEEGLGVLEDISRSVPAQAGNIGSRSVDEAEEAKPRVTHDRPTREEKKPDNSPPPWEEVKRTESRHEPEPEEPRKAQPAQLTPADTTNMSEGQRKMLEESMEKRRRWLEEQDRIRQEEEEDRQSRESRHSRDRDDRRDHDDRRADRGRDDYEGRDRRDRSRDYDDYDRRDRGDRRRRDDDDYDRADDRPVARQDGKISFTDALRVNPSLARGTLTEEEEGDSRRGRRGRGRDDDYDRDYRGRRDSRDDRDYRGRRDSRDDRDYRGRDRDDRRYYRR